MSTPCLDLDTLLALAEGRLEASVAAGHSTHLETCGRCREAMSELRAVGAALEELGRAERAAAPADLSHAVLARLAKPGTLSRLPLPLAEAWGYAALLGRPSVAWSAAAGVVGLVLGGWMAVVTLQGPAEAGASEPYTASSLLLDPENSVTQDYLQVQESGPAAAERADSSLGDSTAARREIQP